MSRPNQQQPDSQASLDPLLASSCLDFLLIELVPLAQRITDQLQTRERALREEYRRSQIFSKQQQNTPTVTTISSVDGKNTSTSVAAVAGEGHARNGSGTTAGSVAGASAGTLGTEMGGMRMGVMDDEMREAVFWRLDGMGYRVGQGLVERFSANRPRPTSPLDAIKFVCKDLWILVFRKQIDNLKTNHRGIFVLTDNRFHALSRMSVDRRAGPKASEDALSRAQAYLYFPCGVIRGALAGLGIEVTVHAETSEIPVASFQIKTKGAKA